MAAQGIEAHRKHIALWGINGIMSIRGFLWFLTNIRHLVGLKEMFSIRTNLGSLKPLSNRTDRNIGKCVSLNIIGPYRLMGSGTIGGVALLEYVWTC